MTEQTPSKSTKSASTSKRVAKPKLSNILKRPVQIRKLEEDDLKYLWGAYRKGGLQDLSPIMDSEMGVEDFKVVIRELVETQYNGAWAVLAPTNYGEIPVGAVFAWVRGGVVQMGDMLWFPWASKRNILEASIIFFHEMRKEAVVLEFARQRDVRFFDQLCRYGVMRTVSRHVFDIYPNETAVLYQTRGIKE